jgi:hypothetical protein
MEFPNVQFSVIASTLQPKIVTYDSFSVAAFIYIGPIITIFLLSL